MLARKIRQDAEKLLELLGFAVQEKDALLGFCLRSVTEHICNATNQPEIPDGLRMAVVYRTVGEYLYAKRISGMEAEDLDLAAVDGVIRSITEGKVKVDFAVGDNLTDAQRLDRFAEALRGAGKADFARYRRLSW